MRTLASAALSVPAVVLMAVAAPYPLGDLRPRAVRNDVAQALSIPAVAAHPGALLWTSFPAETGPAEPDGERLRFRVRAKCADGIGVVRVYGTNGVSLPALVAIDSLPTVAAAPANTVAASAQTLTPPCAVESPVDDAGSRWFHIPATPGSRIGIEVVSRRLGSPFDPFLRLVAPDGRRLVAVDGAPGMSGDCALMWTADGPFRIEIHDTALVGGMDQRFRLRIGDSPPVSGPDFFPADLVPDPDAALPQVRLEAGREPVLELPCRLGGLFDRPGRRHAATFEAAKGTRLRITAASRRLGSPGDVAARLLDAGGKLLAELDATKDDDGVLVHRFDTATRCRLVVSELVGDGGPRHAFALTLRTGTDGFDLTTDAHTLEAVPGGTVEFRVAARRRDFEGAISLRAAGLSAAFGDAGGRVEPKAKEAVFRLSVPADTVPGTLLHFAIMGRRVEGEGPDVVAGTRAALRKSWPEVLQPPPGMDGLIALGIRAKP